MSAVCALFRFDERPVGIDPIERMLVGMRGWGEDRTGTWSDSSGRVALGCRLMRVTPEDAFEIQPLISADGGITLVADARLDNRPELTTELGIESAQAAAMPDSAFIMAAWRKWGSDCVRHMVGDFAFIVWDERTGTLFCARDPLGQRVLFLHRDARRLAVASAIPALLQGGDVPARLNEQKIAELLVLLEDGETTCFEGIMRLPSGHVLMATRDGVEQRRYWTPDPSARIRLASDGEYLEAFREVFRRAVRDRLRSIRPAAIMVSAGLDSSSVAAMAANVLRESGSRLLAFHSAPGDTFTGEAREGWVNDESADVCALAAMHDNIDLTVVRGQESTPLQDAESSFEMLCSPVRNSINLSWVRGIYGAAADSGAGVMLNGGKGNLTISWTGLRSIPDRARRGRLVGAVREAKAVAAARGQRSRDVIRDQVLRPLVPASLLSLYGRMHSSERAPIWQANLSAIRPDFAHATRVEQIARERHQDGASLARASGPEHRYRVLTSAGDGFDVYHLLRGGYPIETREAPTDLRVVEFCLGIPGRQYLRNGRDRLLIRDGMRGLVPASILERTTRGAQAADWTAWFGRMKGDIDAELRALRNTDLARRALDLDRMQALVDRWPERFGPQHMPDYGLLLLRGIMMGRFIRWFEERWS